MSSQSKTLHKSDSMSSINLDDWEDEEEHDVDWSDREEEEVEGELVQKLRDMYMNKKQDCTRVRKDKWDIYIHNIEVVKHQISSTSTQLRKIVSNSKDLEHTIRQIKTFRKLLTSDPDHPESTNRRIKLEQRESELSNEYIFLDNKKTRLASKLAHLKLQRSRYGAKLELEELHCVQAVTEEETQEIHQARIVENMLERAHTMPVRKFKYLYRASGKRGKITVPEDITFTELTTLVKQQYETGGVRLTNVGITMKFYQGDGTVVTIQDTSHIPKSGYVILVDINE